MASRDRVGLDIAAKGRREVIRDVSAIEKAARDVGLEFNEVGDAAGRMGS